MGPMMRILKNRKIKIKRSQKIHKKIQAKNRKQDMLEQKAGFGKTQLSTVKDRKLYWQKRVMKKLKLVPIFLKHLMILN